MKQWSVQPLMKAITNKNDPKCGRTACLCSHFPNASIAVATSRSAEPSFQCRRHLSRSPRTSFGCHIIFFIEILFQSRKCAWMNLKVELLFRQSCNLPERFEPVVGHQEQQFCALRRCEITLSHWKAARNRSAVNV